MSIRTRHGRTGHGRTGHGRTGHGRTGHGRTEHGIAWSWFLTLAIILSLLACKPNLEMVKKQAYASRNLGEAYYSEGDYTSALRELLKAEVLYADDPYLQNDLGLAYLAKGKAALAIGHFEKAIALDPDYAPAMNNLGTAYLVKGDWDAAIAAFKEVSQDLLYATPHYPLSNMGLAYYNKRKYELAETYYQKSLELKPDFLTALIGLGRTHIKTGKLPQAVEILEKAVEQAPRFGANYFYLAEAYALSRKYEKAILAYRKTIEFAPDTPLAEEAEQEIQKLAPFSRFRK